MLGIIHSLLKLSLLIAIVGNGAVVFQASSDMLRILVVLNKTGNLVLVLSGARSLMTTWVLKSGGASIFEIVLFPALACACQGAVVVGAVVRQSGVVVRVGLICLIDHLRGVSCRAIKRSMLSRASLWPSTRSNK